MAACSTGSGAVPASLAAVFSASRVSHVLQARHCSALSYCCNEWPHNMLQRHLYAPTTSCNPRHCSILSCCCIMQPHDKLHCHLHAPAMSCTPRHRPSFSYCCRKWPHDKLHRHLHATAMSCKSRHRSTSSFCLQHVATLSRLMTSLIATCSIRRTSHSAPTRVTVHLSASLQQGNQMCIQRPATAQCHCMHMHNSAAG